MCVHPTRLVLGYSIYFGEASVLPHRNLEVVRQADVVWPAIFTSPGEQRATFTGKAAVVTIAFTGPHLRMRARRHACFFSNLGTQCDTPVHTQNKWMASVQGTCCYLPCKYPFNAVIVKHTMLVLAHPSMPMSMSKRLLYWIFESH